MAEAFRWSERPDWMREEEPAAPDYLGAVRAFRIWLVFPDGIDPNRWGPLPDLMLRSVTNREPWPAHTPLLARCPRGGAPSLLSTVGPAGERKNVVIPPHRPADPACGCGAYGLFALVDTVVMGLQWSWTPGRWLGSPETLVQVAGVAEFWGRTQLHERGLRAEWARPVALLDLPASGPAEARAAFGKHARAVADLYGLPFWSPDRACEAVAATRPQKEAS